MALLGGCRVGSPVRRAHWRGAYLSDYAGTIGENVYRHALDDVFGSICKTNGQGVFLEEDNLACVFHCRAPICKVATLYSP